VCVAIQLQPKRESARDKDKRPGRDNIDSATKFTPQKTNITGGKRAKRRRRQRRFMAKSFGRAPAQNFLATELEFDTLPKKILLVRFL